jgi:hypothetical protein
VQRRKGKAVKARIPYLAKHSHDLLHHLTPVILNFLILKSNICSAYLGFICIQEVTLWKHVLHELSVFLEIGICMHISENQTTNVLNWACSRVPVPFSAMGHSFVKAFHKHFLQCSIWSAWQH